MSDSQQYEKVTVASDGVTVDKRFEEDEFPVPAIAFEIQSSRSETVDVTIVDEVPEDVAVEDLGFHPEYGSEYWTIDEDRITFEREIEANSEYTTVYGIRATGTDNVEQFLTEPTIERVDPPLPDDADPVVDDGASDVVRDVISGDSDSVPGLDDDEDDDVETLNLKDPNDPGSESSDDGQTASEGSSGDLSLDAADVSSLCGALASEIRNGAVTEDDVRLLRKAFDMADDNGGSVDARIQRLQTEVADLVAYTDALEDFLDENGTGEEIIEGFREDVQSFQSDLEEVRDIAEGQEETVASLEETVESVRASMDGIEDDVNGVVSDIDDVEDQIESLEGDMDDLEDQIGDIDVGDVKGDIDEIEDEIDELKEWREQLSSVIGGGD